MAAASINPLVLDLPWYAARVLGSSSREQKLFEPVQHALITSACSYSTAANKTLFLCVHKCMCDFKDRPTSLLLSIANASDAEYKRNVNGAIQGAGDNTCPVPCAH